MDQDKELVEGFRTGRKGAFEVVVARHLDAVYRFLVNLTMTREDAEDLCQETFVEADRSRKGLRTGAALRGWLYKIAYRRYLRWRSKNPTTAALNDDCYIENQVGQIEQRLEIWRAMVDLTDEQRAVFVLAEVEQFDLAEVSDLLGVPMGTVKSRLSRAKAVLRTKLGDPITGEEKNEEDKSRGLCGSNS